MTLVAVSINIDSPDDVDDALTATVRAKEFGADLVEWRIDRMAQQSTPESIDVYDAIDRLIDGCRMPSILTIRSKAEGGAYEGSPAEQRAFLATAIASCGPHVRYVDIEFASRRHDTADDGLVTDRDFEYSIILSMHDTDGRPPDLLKRIAAMADDPSCDVLKAVWTARSLRDNLEAFDLLRERSRPMIALCMGQFGLPSRVLAPKFGGFLTFAAIDAGAETAAGQPTIAELKSTYRFDAITADTSVYGVVGWPVAHSLSPQIHNAGFEAIGFDGVYLPLPVPDAWEHFKATIGAWVDHPHLDFRGASVTLPHKEHLLRFVDERGGRTDEYTRLAGAANTLLVGATGAIVCRNTDAPAIVECLCETLNITTNRLPDLRIAVLGAGGVARAAVAGLMRHDASATIFNRTRDRAETLAETMRVRASQAESTGSIDVGDPARLVREPFDVYINCTSVGMAGTPDAQRTPFEALLEPNVDVPLTDAATVFDTVYTPQRTPLIDEAESRGARIVLGTDLFLRQAALQFESWTGERAPTDLFREVLWRAAERV